MLQEKMYEYLGTNGVLTTPIHLEGIYCIEKMRLIADDEKLLTKDGKIFKRKVIVPISEVKLWYEV